MDDVDFARGPCRYAVRLNRRKPASQRGHPKVANRGLFTCLKRPRNLRRHRVSQGRLGPGISFQETIGNPWTPEGVPWLPCSRQESQDSGASLHSLGTLVRACSLRGECTPRWSRKCSGILPSRSRWTLFACYSVPPGRGCDQAYADPDRRWQGLRRWPRRRKRPER